MTEGNEVGSALGSLDASNLGHGEDIAFFHQPLANEGDRVGLKVDFAAGNGDALGIGLGANSDHVSAPVFIQMGEMFF